MHERHTLDIFLDKAYDDGFALLIEVRDFLKEQRAAVDASLPPNERALLTQELTRLTRRLTDVMAWLLLWRAVSAGEIGHRESLSHAASRLEHDLVAEEQPIAAQRKLPLEVRGMIGRTRRLYGDVLKLKEKTEARA
jgi:regulator of CtrA degradation